VSGQDREEQTVRRPRSQPSQRLNVNISASTMSTLISLAETEGISMTETIRRAVQLLKLVRDAMRDGRELQMVDPESKKVQTIVLV
jgi:hypothetical protein